MTTNIVTIDLTDVALMEDSLEVFIPVTAVSENLKATIEENIQIAKEEFQKNVLNEKDMKWCDDGINLSYQSLHIIVAENIVDYELCVDFEDKENDVIETGFTLKVDLSEHTTELKKLVLTVLIDKFF